MNDFKSGIYLVDDNKEESKERDKLAFIIKESCGSDSSLGFYNLYYAYKYRYDV